MKVMILVLGGIGVGILWLGLVLATRDRWSQLSRKERAALLTLISAIPVALILSAWSVRSASQVSGATQFEAPAVQK